MDFVRKLGVGIVMLVPTFVFAGVVWSWLGSWFAVLGWVIIMAFIYGGVVSGRLNIAKQKS